MKGTFTPIALNTPATVYTNTETAPAAYQVFIDCSAILAGDILKVIIRSNTTAAMKTIMTDYITVDTLGEDDTGVSYPLLMDEDDTFELILNHTLGTVKSYPWSVNKVVYV